MLKAIQTLMAGIEAGAIHCSEWQAWAEREILQQPLPSSWLADLITTSDPSEAQAALGEAWNRYRGNECSVDMTSLLVGFLYEQYVSGEATLMRTLERIGYELDGRNYGHLPCEAVFNLTNELEAACGYEPMVAVVASKAKALFDSHLDAARQARQRLAGGPN